LALEIKEKEKQVNSTGPNPAQAAQLGQKGARARPRWQTCTEALGVLTNCERALSLFNLVTDTLLKSPPTSKSSQGEVHDGGGRRDAPARSWTGRLGLWLGSPSGGHEIGVTMIISPNLIATKTSYVALATVAVIMAAIRSCSRRPEDS
jgi:hypothetical protein